MSSKFLKLGDVEIEKQTFHSFKSSMDVGDVNTDKVVISDEFPFTKRILSLFSATAITKRKYR